MSTHNGSLVPAVGYVRRSSDSESQGTSIPDQIKHVQKYADEKGYRIIRWYTDDAVSGDATEKRLDFLRMIQDATELGDFKAILCWDQARFGRFDSIDFGYYVHPLRKAGVYLATVQEGVTDWNNSSGRIIGTVTQEGKHQQLIDHSHNVTRGQLEARHSGSWLGSRPYAYRIEGKRKAKRLVLDDPGKARVVQRIFREFVEERRPMLNIARRLNADGILSPTGKVNGWLFDSVRSILDNPAYTGDFVGGRYSYGKYHTAREGKIARAERGEAKRSRRPKEEWIIRPNTHEGLIDRATWEKAQELLDATKTGRSRYTPENNPYVLSCLLQCGKCKAALHGTTQLLGKDRHEVHYYECGNKARNGKDACEGTTVPEDVVLRSVADFLAEWLGLEGDALGSAAFFGGLDPDLKPEDLPEAFQKIKKLLMPPARPKADRKRLEKQLEQLVGKLARAQDNLVLLDPGNIPAAQKKIRQLEEERSVVERELRESNPSPERDINSVVLEVVHTLHALTLCCRSLAKPTVYDPQGNRGTLDPDRGDGLVRYGWIESAAPQAVRRLLSHATIVINTVKTGKGYGVRYIFQGGEIVFQRLGVIPGNLKTLQGLVDGERTPA
jgi:DNA invertase Pin-like site-specific DNA recombinase